MGKTNELNNLDKKIYNELISNVNIKEIYLKRLITSDVEMPLRKDLKCKVELKYNCVDYKIIEDNIIEFYPKFEIELDIDEISPVSMQFDFRLLYEIINLETYPNEYIEFFMEKNVPINVWPYARELISSFTTRIGYPPLIISPYKG